MTTPDPLRPYIDMLDVTENEPWPDPCERLRRDRSRDLALLCFAGLVILAIVAAVRS